MKYISDFVILENKELNKEHTLLKLKSPIPLPEILPGQFVEVLVSNSKDTFLRRPLSIHDVNYSDNTLSLFVKIVGEGTRHLSLLKTGETLNLIYPLGNSFSMPEDNNFLLIGGGCGVAPLLYLARYLYEKGFKASTLIGAKTANDIHEVEEYKKYGEIYIATDDGTMGEKGFLTNHSIINSANLQFSKWYVCGPDVMMKYVASIARKTNIDCEVSLENTMACGIGACLCCVVDTTEGHKCVCTEGPVFNTKELKW